MTEYCPHGLAMSECGDCAEIGRLMVEELLDPIRKAAANLEDTVAQAIQSYKKDAELGSLPLAYLLDAIEGPRRLMQSIEVSLAQAIGDSLGTTAIPVPSGRFMMLRTAKARRGWDHAAARRDWMTAVYENMVDKETGEEPSPQEYAAKVLDGAQIGSWKVTPFRNLGLSVDDYCEFEYGPWKPQFEGDADE